MKEKLDIAFIGTPDYPIPAIRGGAIQTLVTALIDKNEENPKFNITIYTINDSELNDIKFELIEPRRTITYSTRENELARMITLKHLEIAGESLYELKKSNELPPEFM